MNKSKVPQMLINHNSGALQRVTRKMTTIISKRKKALKVRLKERMNKKIN